jgi:hypothetical protein
LPSFHWHYHQHFAARLQKLFELFDQLTPHQSRHLFLIERMAVGGDLPRAADTGASAPAQDDTIYTQASFEHHWQSPLFFCCMPIVNN